MFLFGSRFRQLARFSQMKHGNVGSRDASYSGPNVATLTKPGSEPPASVHLLIAGSLVLMATLSRWWFDSYERISREDHIVEWATVVFYLAAAYIGLKNGLFKKRLGDGLVAIYCLVSAGEEFSWGQRLLGLKPPKFFLAENVQQEINIHNFFSPGAHDLVFAILVIGYFVILPLLARLRRTQGLLNYLGATAPPFQYAGWATFLVVLHTWHPIQLSSEWYETILAGLFLLGSLMIAPRELTPSKILVGFVVALLLSLALTEISNAHERRYVAANSSCAKAELQSLLADIVQGTAATPSLRQREALGHRRVFIAEQRGYLNADGLTRFMATVCSNTADTDVGLRRRFVMDPWGLSYWVLVTVSPDGGCLIKVYSFGPNRRRDSDDLMLNAGSGSNDDLVEAALLSPLDVKQNEQSQPQVFSIEDDR
jgi:hypothetical protein